MSKQMKIEISAPNGFGGEWIYATIELPAREYEIQDALHKARIVSDENERYFSVYDCEAFPVLSDVKIETNGIDELNYLAKRLDSLEDYERNVLLAVTPRILKDVNEGDIVSVKNLINLTYGLDKVCVVSNVRTLTELGELAIENELYKWMESVSEEALQYLDRAKIGREIYEDDEGAFINGMYVAAGEYEFQEIYDGKNLPKQELSAEYAFRLELAKSPTDDEDIIETSSERLELPIEREKADNVARKLGVDKIEDCVYLGFESTVPQIESDNFGDMHDFDKLNSLAETMVQMMPSDQVKFKAILSAEEPERIEIILDIAKNLDKYELATQVDDAAQFFKSYLLRHMDKSFDEKWLDTLLLRDEGRELAKRLGATFTDYGVISARSMGLYESVSRYESQIIDEKYDLIEINGQKALFANETIQDKDVPNGLYKYDLRGGETKDFLTIEQSVIVDRSGTILVKEPFDFKNKSYIALTEETSPNFLCEEVTPREFLNGEYDQSKTEELEMKMRGI